MNPRSGARTVVNELSRPRVLALVVGFALALTLTAIRPARASLVMSLDLKELVQRADRIAVVDVVSLESAWDARHERILSTIRLRVAESWKGGPGAGPGATPAGGGDEVTVVQEGGSVDGLTMTVLGMTKFSPGERALVFLRGTATRAQVVGMAQGKRPMTLDRASGQWMVLPPNLTGMMLVPAPANDSAKAAPVTPTAPAAAASARRQPAVVRPVALGTLHAQVDALMKEAATP